MDNVDNSYDDPDGIFYDSDDYDIQFPKLSYNDMQINLRLLCDIKEFEKIIVNDRYMLIDQRFLQGVRRYLSSDSRAKTIGFIEHVINETIDHCKSIINAKEAGSKIDNVEQLFSLQTLLNGTIVGLSRLSVTYGDDKLCRAKIETIQSNIRTFEYLHLKQGITT